MDNNWFLNEDEVDQEELEVALYSQIHFDTVIENVATPASLKCAPDLDFVQPSFQVKVRNYVRKKTENSSVKNDVKQTSPVYNLEFISLSGDHDGCENKDKAQVIPVSISENQPTVATISEIDSHSPDIHDNEGDNRDKSLEEKKSASVSGSSLIICDSKAALQEKPVSNLLPVVICDSSSDDSNSDDEHRTSNSVVEKSELVSEPPPIIICDSDTSDSDDEEKTLQTPVVLKYHRDSDGCNSDDGDQDSKSKEDSSSGSDNDNKNKTRPLSRDIISEELSHVSKRTTESNLNTERDSEQEGTEKELQEEETRYEIDGAEKDVEFKKSDDVISKGGMTASLNTPKSYESNKKWALDERDRHIIKTPVNRYFNPKTIRCRNCKEEGHLALFCSKEKKSVCIFCGKQGHHHLSCPEAICFKCCTPGHKPSNCVDAKRNRYIECYRCWLKGHIGKACPDLWRQYHQTIGLDSTRIVKADFQPNSRVYCYNCGHKGHLGFECDRERMGLYVYPSYPFVAEYDKGRINRASSHRRVNPQKRQSDLLDMYREMEGDNYHKREKRKERQDDSSHMKGNCKEKQDKKTHRKAKDKKIIDSSSHRQEKQNKTRDNNSLRKEKTPKIQDDNCHRKGKTNEIQEDSSLRTDKNKRKTGTTRSDRKQEHKENQDGSLHKGGKEGVKESGDYSNKKEKNSEKQLKKAGKKRKTEESEAVERKVSKCKKSDATTNGIDNLRIQVNHHQLDSPKVSLEKSSMLRKERKKNKDEKTKKNRDVEKKKNRDIEKKKNRDKERQMRDNDRRVPETFVSGTSQFIYQEPTQSKYAENIKSFNSSEVEHPVSYRYNDYDAFLRNKITAQFQSRQKKRTGRGNQAFNEIDQVREEGEIEDYSDDMFLEFESFKPSAKKRRKYNKRRDSPISFIGLMD